MEKREETLLQKLQQEAVQVPDSLLPENVRRRLEALPDDTERMRRRHKISWRFLALPGCCIAAAVLFICLLLLNSTFVENNTPQIEAVRNATSISAHNAVNAMENYITAYEKLNEYHGQQIVLEKRNTESLLLLNTGAAQSKAAKTNRNFALSTSDQNNYSDTNVRTEGVNEADIVKTDGNFIYICNRENHTLEIYQVPGNEATMTPETKQVPDDETTITSENKQVLDDEATMTSENKQVADDETAIASENKQVANDEAAMTSENKQVANDEAAMASENKQTSSDKVKKIAEISLKKQTKGGWLEDMYLSGDRLTVICTLMSPKLKQLKKLYEEEGQSYENFNKSSWISGDYGLSTCGTYDDICVKYPEGSEYFTEYTATYVYDISNQKKPALLHTFFQDGGYSSSRMSEGVLYLFSQREFNTENLDYEDITSYIPQIGGECVAAPDVTVSQKNSVNRYTCIAAIDPTNCEYLSKNSVLGGTEHLYVSAENIYLMDYNSNTCIIKLGYQKGIVTKTAEGNVKGWILDDYSVDERKDHLRVVTTYTKENGNLYNGLFILDENLTLTGKLANLAKNETVYSARFIDDTAYFVTYENTDPLFAVDVSKPSAPKLLGHLKIPGFSEYLHPYGKHLLLGIGEETDSEDTWTGIKLSMFDITNPAKLKETHKLVLPKKLASAVVTSNPNALFIDTEKNLFGFSADNYKDNETHYMVFSYDEEKGFTTLLNTSFSESFIPCRGLYIDDRFYVVGVGKGIKVFDLGSFERLN